MYHRLKWPIALFFNKTKAHVFLMIGLIASLFSCSTNKSEDKESFTIGFSQCVGSDFFRKTMLDEMKTQLSFYPDINFVYAEAENSSARQIEQVHEMINKGIDLLIISPNEAHPLTPVVEEVFNKGIPVIVLDRKTSSSLYTAYVGADNYTIGKRAGEYVANILNGKGSVLEVMGLAGSSPAIERQRGFSDAIKQVPGIIIKKQVYGNWLPGKAELEVSRVASSLPDIDAVFAHNDPMAMGAYRALKLADPQNQIKIIGVDALPKTGLKLVAEKVFNASLLYPTGGKEAIRTALQILRKESFQKENILETVVVDSTNVQLMRMQAEKISSQQKDIENQNDLLVEQRKVYNSQKTLLNILIVTLVLAIIFGGIGFYSLVENWKNNKELEAKNDEIIKQRNTVVEMSEKARLATDAKFNFFTNISHEFRTPLTLILLPLEELLIKAKGSASEKHLKMIQKNVFRLIRLVNQLIDFRKIELNKMMLRATETDIIAFAREITDAFRETAEKRNIDLRLIHPEKKLPLWIDVNMLDKVLFNLLSNAFKFVRDGGNITLNIYHDTGNECAVIILEDDGSGMTEETAERAFDFFYQGSDKTGSGLGLALSKELIQLHKGEISVKSKKWKGTTFTLTIPTGDAHLMPEERIDKQINSYISWDDVKIYTADSEDQQQTVLENKSFDIIKEHSVLIIEDNDDMRNLLEQKFSQIYEVYSAPNGEAGITEAFEKVPDLIISDVVLPIKNGFEITNVLKSNIRTSHIPIILLTAKGSMEQQLEGIKNKADSYIVKPFNMQFLLEKSKSLLENRILLRDHYSSDVQPDLKGGQPNKLDKKFLNNLSGIIESNLSNENLNVDDICKGIGISRVQLYRKVKALLGCGVTDYILSRRLKKAKYLLLQQDLTVSEVAFRVGFASSTYFATVFKNQYGCTPSDFKKKKSNPTRVSDSVI